MKCFIGSCVYEAEEEVILPIAGPAQYNKKLRESQTVSIPLCPGHIAYVVAKRIQGVRTLISKTVPGSLLTDRENPYKSERIE